MPEPGSFWWPKSTGSSRGRSSSFPDASRSRQGQWPAGAATIRLLAVRPEARGRGLGTRLTQECLRRARALKIPTIYLYTGRFMLAAQQIYEKLGFQRAPEFDPPWAAGADCLSGGFVALITDCEEFRGRWGNRLLPCPRRLKPGGAKNDALRGNCYYLFPDDLHQHPLARRPSNSP